MGLWKRFRRLSWRERRFVAEAAATILATRAGLRIGLRTGGGQRWRSLLSRAGGLDRADAISASAEFRLLSSKRVSGKSKRAPHGLAPSEMARLTFSTANSLFFRASCLERSLALWWMLRRRGIEAELQLGAKKNGSLFEAHAWVEVGGVALGDAGGERESFVKFGETGDPAAMAAGGTR